MIKRFNYSKFIFSLFLLFFPIPFFAGNSFRLDDKQNSTNVKPITGTFLNLAYQDVRNKYTDPQSFDNTDPALWKAKIDELSGMGIKYLIIMEVANDGKAYYPSKIMPWVYDSNHESPVDAILDEAGKDNMKVFLSTGWAKDQDDNLLDPKIKERQLEIMEELAGLYKNKQAFYGWYLPVEDCLCPILPEHSVQSVNALVKRAHQLTPGKKTLISPYGIGLSDFNNPNFYKQLKKLHVDIIAYQDEVGCVRDKFPIPRLKLNWKRVRAIHNKLNIEMWANCETFTWEKEPNSRESALIPANYSRLLSQQVAASEGGVDNIISFMFQGIIEDPKSDFQLGQPMWSNTLYRNYMSWKKGSEYWKLMEQTFTNSLKNNMPPLTLITNNLNTLKDNKLGEEDSNDSNWVRFDKGYHELTFDFRSSIPVNEVFIRTLNYHRGGIEPVMKIYIYFSQDGKSYDLASIKNSTYYPNNNDDAWIDGILFNHLGKNARFMKIAFRGTGKVYMDEVFLNPEKKL